MKRICVVTSSRADYGILKPLLTKIKKDGAFLLTIAVTGTHLASDFGFTCEEIEEDGFTVDAKIDIQVSGKTALGVSHAMGKALIGFADYFSKENFDFLIILGDRYEIMAVCCAAVNQHLPIGHLHGGELTQGALDDSYRHAITKLSNFHFVSTEIYRKRVIQLGEQPETVFNVGALGVENVLHVPLLSINELENSIGFSLSEKPYAVVTFHPVTVAGDTGIGQVKNFLAAIDNFPNMNFLITKANADAGGSEINDLWKQYADKHNNCCLVDSLGMKRYLSALKYSKMMVGNSSSGIIEGPAMKIPVVNIGDRQKGRLLSANIINCKPEKHTIVLAMQKALTKEFQILSRNVDNIYGDGDTSEKIMTILKKLFSENKISIEKKFHDN